MLNKASAFKKTLACLDVAFYFEGQFVFPDHRLDEYGDCCRGGNPSRFAEFLKLFLCVFVDSCADCCHRSFL